MVLVAESQLSQNSHETTSPQGSKLARNILAAIVIIVCFVGLPFAYAIGHFSGFDAGYSEGWSAGEFGFYYVKPQQRYGVYDLSDWISKWEWIEPYKENVFDCSEMSAYLERKLENEGWHTLIIVGDCPFASGGHAWLLVETSGGKYSPVESTDMDVVWSNDPNLDKYFVYDNSFETIQDALDYNEAEFDWWKR